MVSFSTPFFGVGFLKLIPKRYKLNLKTISDLRGRLTVIEKLPFDIKRVYYLHHIDTHSERGGHAHRALKRLMVAVNGSFILKMRDKSGWHEITMDSPETGIFINPLEWLELSNFSEGAVCLVLASEEHDEADCIRDFKVFKNLCKSA
jgi:hypothetical protein